MDILKAIKLLDEGKKIRDIKMPSGVYLEKRNGKIVSNQSREGVSLNTDAEYEIYEEPKPKYINEICILLGNLDQYTKEKCTYVCNKCELYTFGICHRDILEGVVNNYKRCKLRERGIKDTMPSVINLDIPNYDGETFVKMDISKDSVDRILNNLRTNISSKGIIK